MRRPATTFSLRDLHSTPRVLGHNVPLPLGDIFTAIFILDKPQAFRRIDIQQISQDPDWREDDENRISSLRLVPQPFQQRLSILGQPGAGKTTFLTYLTLRAPHNHPPKISIFISLKE